MSSTVNVQNLFQTAQNEGQLSTGGAAVLNIPDIGAQIQAGIGISVDDVPASEVTLVTPLIDDSGSIRFAGNADVVRQGHNGMLDALNDTKQRDGILVHCRYLNGVVLYPYTAIKDAVRMTAQNYDPNGGTPFYDQAAVTLATVVAKAQEFNDAGVPCRTVTVLVTDGNDQHSTTHTRPEALAPLIKDMLRSEMHIICFMGIDDSTTDFRAVANAMGIPDQWILTPKNTPSEIRKAFAVVSQSAVRASQAAGQAFSRVAGGGFGAP